MLRSLRVENVLFMDIETVPQWAAYADCPENIRQLWNRKVATLPEGREGDPEALWPRAGIYAEFGRVICISTACIRHGNLYLRSYRGHDETALLADFAAMLDRSYRKDHHLLCAHNGKEFDFPFLCRRMLINGIGLPAILDTAGLKPWQVRHLDTMELWKFGDRKHYTSLELLAAVFGLPTPKDEISGADVHQVYREAGGLERIVRYCEKDVVTLTGIFLRYRGDRLPGPGDILHA